MKNIKQHFIIFIAVSLILSAALSGCGSSADVAQNTVGTAEQAAVETDSQNPDPESDQDTDETADQSAGADAADGADDTDTADNADGEQAAEDGISADSIEDALEEIPDYSGSAYIEINDSVPFFTEDEMSTEAFETYSDLDRLGRCGTAYANICQEIMPTEERGAIGSVKPSGWHTVKYDVVEGNYLYNRCHLIAYELAGENANEENLITGTRYFNATVMLPFENEVADYVKATDHHVLYRVTPVFTDDNLVADGVLMEALSVEDEGKGVEFCVFCYNVQPGIDIDYATGDSRESEEDTADTASSETEAEDGEDTEIHTYILNTNTKKFHYPDCSSVSSMKESNRQEYTGTRSDIILQGYSPCGNCNP